MKVYKIRSILDGSTTWYVGTGIFNPSRYESNGVIFTNNAKAKKKIRDQRQICRHKLSDLQTNRTEKLSKGSLSSFDEGLFARSEEKYNQEILWWDAAEVVEYELTPVGSEKV